MANAPLGTSMVSLGPMATMRLPSMMTVPFSMT